MALFGQTLPTWALQQVVGYLRYNGRDANVVAKEALDPKRTKLDFENGSRSTVSENRLS
jgi:hypothetical protein